MTRVVERAAALQRTSFLKRIFFRSPGLLSST